MDPLQLLRSFFPPDLHPAYLVALLKPTAETLGLVFGAMGLAFPLGLMLALAVAMKSRGASAVVFGLSAFRAIPDLTLAILCVVLVGIGPAAGLVALTLYYTAAVAKVFSDLLATAPPRPLEALQSAGASRFQLALFGRAALTRDDLLSYGAYALECALRSAVIVGAVGGGGIGAELVGSLAAFDFHRAATLILLMLVLIAGLDQFARWLRRRPRTLLVLAPLALAAAVAQAPRMLALEHALGVVAEMLPPTLPPEALAALPRHVLETVAVALVGTLGGAAAGLAAALAASRTLAPAWLNLPARRLLDLVRTVPEVVWGLVLMAVAGVGPVLGAVALGLHSFGSLGRLFADALDNAPEPPQRAIAATGASPLVVALVATAPLAAGPMLTHLLFRLEWNMRMATVLGLIGGGGVGQALYEAQQLFFYPQVLAYVLVTAALILLTDFLGARLRARIASGSTPQPGRACGAAGGDPGPLLAR